MLINGYKTSNDYEALFELMQTQRVTCFIYFLSRYIQCETEIPNYDTEETNKPFRLRNCEPIVVWCETKEAFIKECRALRLRFISPFQEQTESTLNESLLKLFQPIVFESPEALYAKAKELNCVPFEGAEDIQYLHHVAAKMYKTGHRLFYFKKAFSVRELEHLVGCDGYKEVDGKPNIFINCNHNTGVLYVVENLAKEPNA